MRTIDQEIELLIVKYLVNDLNEEESLRLKSWIEYSDDNRKAFEEYQKSWNFSEEAKVACSIDVECDWQKVKSKLFASKKMVQSYWWWSVAAVFVLVISLGALTQIVFNPSNESAFITYTSDSSVQTVMLSDGSMVVLNKKSTLKVPKSFNSNREVVLQGNALFSVVKLNGKSFVVNTNHGNVRVLGTKFIVNDPESGESFDVLVESGKVLMSAKDKSVVLIPGMHGALIGSELTISESESNSSNNWVCSKIVFKSASLEEIVEQLKVYYCVFDTYKILSPDTSTRVSTTFENQSFEEVIQELSTHFGKKFIVQNRTLIISD